MERVKKNFGFGMMRLPMTGDRVDLPQTCRMVDAFLAAGFNYFDTAHGYISELSEPAIKAALTSRYPREAYILTDKLSGNYFQTEADIRPMFETQLAACGVDYFDFYLMHAQSQGNYGHYRACRAYETAFQLKAEGKIRHVGISFHDTPAFLERILADYPQIEVVQLQLNYLDWDDPAVASRQCYEVCRKHGKPVIVMEPVKGGTLAQLPPQAQAAFDELGGGSSASYAIRFAAGHEGIFMVLSGMSDMAQMEDNLSFMTDFRPLDQREREAVDRARGALRAMGSIPCTACRYCVDGCPMGISIPDLFACLNSRNVKHDWNAEYYYDIHTRNGGKASDCVKCGKCEAVCPQKLEIRSLLEEVARVLERPAGSKPPEED